ncbi:Uncharacterised protein [Mycobacteroides abscessus subsp. abscessus]|nr:Uncharacterised protein [Mycobacteroides abscessus subsp. abscessus]
MDHICHLEFRHAALLAAEKVSGPPQFQILFTENKAIIGLRHDFHPFFPDL